LIKRSGLGLARSRGRTALSLVRGLSRLTLLDRFLLDLPRLTLSGYALNLEVTYIDSDLYSTPEMIHLRESNLLSFRSSWQNLVKTTPIGQFTTCSSFSLFNLSVPHIDYLLLACFNPFPLSISDLYRHIGLLCFPYTYL